MKQILLLLILGAVFNLQAQTYDDFEDGNFTQNPTWSGDQEYFVVNTSNQLQLDDVDENSAYLSTIIDISGAIEWRCWIKLAFSPSSNNNARYYLMSDIDNLKGSLVGYFLQLGESGSDDAIELFRQDGTEVISVCRGTDGTISSSFEVRVKVTRDAGGKWQLYADYSGGEDFIMEAEGVDNTYTQTSYIGFVCNYTKSNSTKMYFDDVYAGPIIIDNEPPKLLSAVAENDSSVILIFDEVTTLESIEIVLNYFINNEIGNPLHASHDEVDKTMVLLDLLTKLELGTNYFIDVSGIQDLSGNTMEPTQLEFSYYRPQPFDIVINEIMADPTPPIGLPEYEYLELYNQTESTIDLEGWVLTIGTSEKEFTAVSIVPNGYLILAKEIAYYDFIDFGDFYGFASFSLTNSGQTIQLQSSDGVIISTVSYTDSWYNDQEKEEGGWSIEQKNSSNICSGKENWTASVNAKGGSPGAVNSVANDIVLFPELMKLEILSDNIVQLVFNQNMNETTLGNSNLYSVDGGINSPSYVDTYSDNTAKVDLIFENSFLKGALYELTISSTVSNCMLLNMKNDTVVTFGLPEKIAQYDIIINEILFNPWTGGEDYVELFNRSEKIINLQELQIGSVKISPPNPADTTIYAMSSEQKLLIPNDYIVITESSDAVRNQYFTSSPNAFLKVDPFPPFNNDDGHVIIISDSIVVDSFSYSEDLHFPLLIYHDGVSLERINPNVNISDNSNWHSAAESVGFGTPGYENSQYVNLIIEESEISIEPEIFSPDNDGYDDIINVVYNFDKPGYVMSIIIYNSNGYLISKLVNNEYLGTKGTISWDGIQDNNSKAPVGIYIFYITVFDVEGNVKKYKKTGVLATKL